LTTSSQNDAAGRKVTFNIPIDAAGRINPAPLAQPRG
jgi:hypothetical protein